MRSTSRSNRAWLLADTRAGRGCMAPPRYPPGTKDDARGRSGHAIDASSLRTRWPGIMTERDQAGGDFSAADQGRFRQLVEGVRDAARGLETVALSDEVLSQRQRTLQSFDRAMSLLYRAGDLPSEALLRALLDACGCGSARLTPLVWARQHFVHQFLTREFVSALAAFLAGITGPILEVGAGRRDLARALCRRGVAVIATDDGLSLDGRLHWSSGIPVAVEALSYTAALARHKPVFVLCSWMPLGKDWTPAFRACPSVRSFLLIGEGPGGCTGTPASFDVPPGWRRSKLAGLGRLGLTRNADRTFSTAVYHFSRT